MDKIIFTDEQQKVIDAPIEDILVSAAAGSGKTTVLVQRIIEKILRGDYSLDQILVVTFTRDAASHMKQKIATELRNCINREGAAGGDRETVKKLRAELAKLPNSYIQTIDSFCTRVINEKSHVCADRKELKLVEAGAAVLGESELDLIMTQAASEAIEESYQELDPHFEELTHMFGDGRNDNGLAECLVKVYKRLRSMPDYMDICHDFVDKRKRADEEERVLGLEEVIDRIVETFAFVDDRTVSAVREYADYVSFLAKDKDNDERKEWFLALTDRVYEYTRKIIAAHNRHEDPKVLWKMIKDEAVIIGSEGDKYNGLPNSKADDTDEVQEFKLSFGPVAAVLLLLKKVIGIAKAPSGYGGVAEQYLPGSEITDILMRTPEEFLFLQRKRTDAVESFVGLIGNLDSRYAELKARVHGMDFPDQEHLAKLILSQEEAGEYYRNKFREIYIDEYQDNSALQDAIIELIARDDDRGNVFRVGDVKQSIYKFRYANPSRFIQRANELRREDTRGELFTLNCNHRSSVAILDLCNIVFEQLMCTKATEIEYNEEHRLNHPENKADGELPRVVLVNNYGIAKSNVTSDGQLHFRNFTPQAVQREIEYYMQKGIEPGQICVLTRSGKMAAQIAYYLGKADVPAFYAQELDIFADEEVHGICNILIAVANERRDEFLTGILLSAYRVSNFTLDELAEVHLYAAKREKYGRDLQLIDKLRIYAGALEEDVRYPSLQARICAFLDWFDDLRSDLVITDIGMLVDRIYRDTGVCAASVAAAEKFSLFKKWLISNFMRFGSDISAIATRLEDMKIKLGGSATVSQDVEYDDRVKCMTIHGSKGLEFDCVIIAELGSNTPGRSDDRLTFDKDMGFVTEDYSEEELSVYTSIESIARSSKERLSDISEDLRLLYVAMTRAKKNLSILAEANLDVEEPEDGKKKSKKGDSYGKMIRSVLRQPAKAISRQHWLTMNSRMVDAFIASLIRLRGADLILQRLNDCFNAGAYDGMVVPIDFEGLECVIYDDLPKPDQIDEADLLSGDTEDEPEGSETDIDNEEFVLLIQDDRQFDGELFAEGVDDKGMPIFPAYPYESASKIPFKVSVSQLQEDDRGELKPLNLKVQKFSHYVDRLNGDVGENAAETGTFVHRLLRFIDLAKSQTEADFRSEVDKLADLGIIRTQDKEKAYSFADDIVRFAQSDLGQRLAAADNAGRAEYEKPIVFEIPVSDTDHALAQGIIDCIFYEEDGEAVILDYKTDSMYGVEDSAEARSMVAMERHGIQIDCYAAAVQTAGISVKEKYLVLLRFGEYVKI